jgi:hypothetical protein
MKKWIYVVLALIASHLVAFLAGSTTGKHIAMNYIAHESKRANAQVALGHYTIYRDIAKDLKVGKQDSAKCNAELGASAMLDSIKTCLADDTCGATAIKQMQTNAPEVIGNNPLDFSYIDSKAGIKRCNQ